MHSIGEASAPGDGGRRAVGIGTTLLLHATLGWAAWSGLDAAAPTVPVPLEVRFIEAAQAPVQPMTAAPLAAPPTPAPAPAPQARVEPPTEPVAEPPAKPVVEPSLPPLVELPPPLVEPPPPVVREPRSQPVRKPHPKPVRKAEKPRRAAEPPPPKLASPVSPSTPPTTAVVNLGAAPPQPVSAPAAASPSPISAPPTPTLAAAAPAAPVQAPRFDAAYLRNPPPAYPRASRRLGEEGRVVLRVRVERDGSPSRLEVQASSGSTRLDDAAFDAVRHWRFVAARRGDDNVAAWVLVPIEFHLDNG